MDATRSAATAVVIGAAGDLLMQIFQRQQVAVDLQDPLDTARTARLAAYRMFHAPFIDAAWRLLDTRIRIGGVRGVFAKVLADQTLLMPPSLFTFFLSQGVMEGLSVEQSLARAVDSLVPTATVCLPYWGCVHMLTFSVVRSSMRIAWASTAAVGWNAYMSLQNQRAVARERACTTPSCEPTGATRAADGIGPTEPGLFVACEREGSHKRR
uniref:Uncharacterized protein n=1 Tax=Calcidiscus leptoporus TaxID=127549 RepID=A0A7S0JJS2_9EUKA